NGRDEIGEMVPSRSAARRTDAGKGLGPIPPARIESTRADDGAFLQMEGVANHLIAIARARQTANLEDELRPAIIEEGDLGVGSLALVGIAEAAAQANDAAW